MEDPKPNKEVQESVNEKKETIPDKENVAVKLNAEETPSLKPKTALFNIITAFVNGAGIGLLLGTLLGLSISPVVSGVIATLSGLLAVLLGTSEKYMSPVKSLRLGAFGFCCVAGIMLGIHIRTNNAMMPDREKMLQDYMKVGYSKQEALDFIAFREFNLVPAGWKSEPKPSEDPEGPGTTGSADTSDVSNESGAAGKKESHHSNTTGAGAPGNAPGYTSGRKFASANDAGAERKSVLYSSEVSASDCDLLNNADAGQDMSEIINTFEMAGGTWQELEKNMISAGLPEKVFVSSILMIRDCFCASGKKSGTIKVTYNPKLNAVENTQTLKQIEDLITPKDKMLFMIKEQINKNIAVEYRKPLYLSVIKTFCHE